MNVISVPFFYKDEIYFTLNIPEAELENTMLPLQMLFYGECLNDECNAELFQNLHEDFYDNITDNFAKVMKQTFPSTMVIKVEDVVGLPDKYILFSSLNHAEFAIDVFHNIIKALKKCA